MSQSIHSFEEFTAKYPGLERVYYDALKNGKYVLRLRGKDLTIYHELSSVRREIGNDKTMEVWGIAQVIKSHRAVALVTCGDGEPPSFLVSGTL